MVVRVAVWVVVKFWAKAGDWVGRFVLKFYSRQHIV